MQTFILESDDLMYGMPGLEDVMKLKEHYPNLKFTFFMVPIPDILLAQQSSPDKYKEWAKYLKQDWIEICPHGLTHQGQEFLYRLNRKNIPVLLDYETAKTYIKAAEKTFEQLDLPYKKIWKSPHWATSPGAYDALMEMGYKIACDPNQPYPDGAYLYNWSFDTPISRRPVVKGHGHLYGNNNNTVRKCIGNLMQIPSDSEFLFVSEAMEKGL